MKTKLRLSHKLLLSTIVFILITSQGIIAQPKISCYGWMPKELVYDRATNDYSPNPFLVRYRITNVGDSALLNANAKITYNKNDLTLVSPISDTQALTPNVIAPNDSGIVQWDLYAKKRMKGDSVGVCITITFDNFPDDRYCWKVWIPPTESIIECSLTAPTIILNNTKDRYIPMPFILTADISNDGGLVSDSLFATIYFLPDLKLTAIQNNNVTKVVSPYKLFPGQHGTVTWELDHPISFDSINYQVRVKVRERDKDSTTCEIQIQLPGFGLANVHCVTKGPDTLRWIDSLKSYDPNPFPVTVSAVNTGTLDADSVHATIILPADVVLDPPTQPMTKFFNPMKMEQWQNGMPPNELTWQLRATTISKKAKKCTIEFKIEGVSVVGAIDTSYCQWDVTFQPVTDILTCRMYAPDSLGLDSTKTGVEPNPFYIRYVLKNIGNASIGIQQVQLSIYNGSGVSVIPPPPALIVLNKPLIPGDSLDIKWKILVKALRIFRLPRFLVSVINEDGDWYECWLEIPIRNLSVSLNCFAQGPDTIHYNPVLKTFSPNPFVGEFDLFNAGGDFLNNVLVVITTLPPEIELLEDTWKTIPVIAPAKTERFTWQMQLSPIGRNLSVGKLVRISVSYESDGTPRNDTDCFADVFIEANPFPTSVRPNQSLTVFDLKQNFPNPFSTSTTITFNLTPTLSLNKEREIVGQHRATLKVFDVFGREVLDLSDKIDNPPSADKLTIDNFQLPATGIYFYRLTIGNESQIKMMMMIR